MKKSIFNNWKVSFVCDICNKRISGSEDEWDEVKKDHIKACQEEENMRLAREDMENHPEDYLPYK